MPLWAAMTDSRRRKAARNKPATRMLSEQQRRRVQQSFAPCVTRLSFFSTTTFERRFLMFQSAGICVLKSRNFLPSTSRRVDLKLTESSSFNPNTVQKAAGTLRVPSADSQKGSAFRGLRHMECAYYFAPLND